MHHGWYMQATSQVAAFTGDIVFYLSWMGTGGVGGYDWYLTRKTVINPNDYPMTLTLGIWTGVGNHALVEWGNPAAVLIPAHASVVLIAKSKGVEDATGVKAIITWNCAGETGTRNATGTTHT